MSIMKEYAIKTVEKIFVCNDVMVKNLYKLRFDSDFSLSKLEKLDKDDLYAFVKELELKLAELKSGINIKYLAICIQMSSSSQVKPINSNPTFICKKCGKEELNNSSSPLVCMDCAEKMAEKIVKSYKLYMCKGE